MVVDLAPQGAEIANEYVDYVDKRNAEATGIIFLKADLSRL